MNLPLTLLSLYITIEWKSFHYENFCNLQIHSTESDNEKLKQLAKISSENPFHFAAFPFIIFMNTDFFRFQYKILKRTQKAEEGKTLNCKIENELKKRENCKTI